ncbi:MAG: F0F1 ATP synthase subunit B [Vicinamibacteria bacterium]|nr:F0F1 ATP synthase subunit B [Vicinamibacteria bacterium]
MINFPLFHLATAEAGGKSFTDVDFVLFVATLVLFGLFAALLAKFGWRPLLRIIEEREKNVRDAVEGAQKANADAEALLEQHRVLMRDATREREQILKKAIEEAEHVRDEIVTQARTEGEHALERARVEIARETNLALSEIRDQVADLAVLAASRIVTSSLTPEAQRKLVDDFITTLPPLQAPDRP